MESTHIVYPFSGPQPGPLRPIGSNARAIELFHIFFSDEALELVVAETNRYAAQCRAHVHPQHLVPGMISHLKN